MDATEHVHHSGEIVTETGHYLDKDGDHIELKQGESFPNCPKSGQQTTWRHEAVHK
jgi:hypothetical protein